MKEPMSIDLAKSLPIHPVPFLLTSFPVGICLANLTFAKFPFPMVLSRRYFPMWGSSELLDFMLVREETLLLRSSSPLYIKTKKEIE